MNIQLKNGKVTIDGKEFCGGKIQINGNKVVVDGVTQDGELVGDISIVVNGDVDFIENTSGSITCNNAGNVRTVSGDVKCSGSISGFAQTVSGDISAQVIHGPAKTVSGDIRGVK